MSGLCTSLVGLVTQMGIAPVCISVAVKKHKPKATPGGEERVPLAHTWSLSLLWEDTAGAWRQGLKQKPQRRLSCLFDRAQAYLPRDGASHHALGLHTSMKQCHTDKAPSQSDEGRPPTEGPLFPRVLTNKIRYHTWTRQN